VTPSDWLLLLIAARPSRQGLDPIRLQKGMFLLAREAGIAARERYWFVPYNYGPMSPALYRDLERMEQEGLVERTLVLDESWRRLTVTEAGMQRARTLRRRARRGSPEAVQELSRIKRAIVRMTFAELIADVYRRYPYFARRSVFPPSFSARGGDGT
jgi:hypothetical protein